ncbi:MAG: HD domain-containing protein, partial [Lachnospiraceae bacterium]|nr:HD domain-containing protein [Lachnospiraceae bacterium]
MNTREFLNILHIAERLKDTPRHCTTSKRRVESVAEHSWRVSLMASLLRGEFPDIDIDKVVNMCLIHDLGECFTGDIPTFDKTDQDRDTEDALLKEWIDSLPKEVADYMKALYAEMDAQDTKESKLYKALDKLEALIQHNESPIDTWSENEYELNKT